MQWLGSEEEDPDILLACIQKRFALSPQLLFSKATEMSSGVFKGVSAVNNVNALKTRVNVNKAFWSDGGEVQKFLRIQANIVSPVDK